MILTFPAVIFLLLLCQPFNYPAKSDLVFEECTFIRYEYKYYDPIKGSDYEEYHIFVEEYDEPLEISNTTFDEADINALQNLKTGDKVTISIDNHFDQLFLYSLSCENTYILSYDDYLSENIEVDKTIIIICIGFIIFGIAFSLIDVIYKKIKGKSLFWRNS